MNVLESAEKHGHYKKVSSRKGGEYHGPCPMCGGNDRFHIWPEENGTGGWWCRGCNKGGDLIQWLIDVEGMTFPEACKAVGRDLPEQQEGKTPQVKRPAGDNWRPSIPAAPADLWREHAEKFVENCHQQLLARGEEPGSPLHYLAGRGIKKESAVAARLGWNAGEKDKDAYRAREAWGLETILKDNKKKKLWLPIGLVIPNYVDGALRRVRIRIPNERRTPDFSTPYYVVPGSGSDTYVIAPGAKAFVIVEAELDSILVAQEIEGLNIGAMAMGNNSAKPTDKAYALLDAALHISVALDYDLEAGNNKNPGGSSWLWWREHFPQAERWPVPVGKDPGDAYKAGCSIREWIKENLPPIFHISGGKKEKAKVTFNSDRAHHLVQHSQGRIGAEFKSEGWQWLQQNRPQVIQFIKAKEDGIEAFFTAEDEQGLTWELQVLEAAYKKAWKIYEERPPVIARCKMEGGDCVCCGNCRESEEE